MTASLGASGACRLHTGVGGATGTGHVKSDGLLNVDCLRIRLGIRARLAAVSPGKVSAWRRISGWVITAAFLSHKTPVKYKPAWRGDCGNVDGALVPAGNGKTLVALPRLAQPSVAPGTLPPRQVILSSRRPGSLPTTAPASMPITVNAKRGP